MTQMKIKTCLIADEQSHGLVRNETVQKPMAYFRRFWVEVIGYLGYLGYLGYVQKTFQQKTAASIAACISVKLLTMI